MDESGDEGQYGDVPAESATAPFFEMKLKHYKIFEGMPVTFTCRVAGNPKPKVSGRRHFLSITVTTYLSDPQEEFLWFIGNNQITKNAY